MEILFWINIRRKLGEADSEEEIDFTIYLNQAQYELRWQ